MLGVGDGPPPLAGLNGFIFTPQASLQTAVTMWALLVTLLFLFFAKLASVH